MEKKGFNRFSGIKELFTFSKDFDVDDTLANFYGQDIKDAYAEISKTTKKKFKETLDINDQLLEKYSKKSKEDVQKELMKKYLVLSQDDLNKEALEKEKMEEEVDSSLEGVDKDTKEQVKKDLAEEQKDKKENELDEKDKKKALQTKIYEATYNKMYKDYTSKVMDIKNAQFENRDIALTTKEAMSIIAMEKNLEKIDLLYHNHTGKDITKVEQIKKEKADFNSKFNYNEKGIEYYTNQRSARINDLYRKRAEEYQNYIKALKDPSKTPQEKAIYKRDYEKANLELLQNVPSLNEYTKDLEIQGENEKLAKEEKLEEKTAINSRLKNQGKVEKVTESKMAGNVYNIESEKERRNDIAFYNSEIQQKDAIEKGDLEVAKKIGDAQRDNRVYDENIEKLPQSSLSQTKDEVKREEEISNLDFFASLRKIENIEDKTPEELEKIAQDRQKDAEDKIKENAYKEQIQQKTEYERYRKHNKRPNNGN